MKFYLFSSLIFLSISPPILANPTLESASIQSLQLLSPILDKLTQQGSLVTLSLPHTSKLRVEPIKPIREFKVSNTTALPSLEADPQKPPIQNPLTSEERLRRINLPSLKTDPKKTPPDSVKPEKPNPNSTEAPPSKNSNKKPCIEKRRESSEITGSCSDAFKQKIKTIVEEYSGRILSLIERKNLQDEITLLLIQEGYITSKAELENSDATEDRVTTPQIVKIRIIEGTLDKENVTVESNGKTSKTDNNLKYLENYVIEKLQPALDQSPFNVNKLEEQLQILKNDRLFTQDNGIEAILKPGNNGESNLVLKVKEREYSGLSRQHGDNFS